MMTMSVMNFIHTRAVERSGAREATAYLALPPSREACEWLPACPLAGEAPRRLPVVAACSGDWWPPSRHASRARLARSGEPTDTGALP